MLPARETVKETGNPSKKYFLEFLSRIDRIFTFFYSRRRRHMLAYILTDYPSMDLEVLQRIATSEDSDIKIVLKLLEESQQNLLNERKYIAELEEKLDSDSAKRDKTNTIQKQVKVGRVPFGSNPKDKPTIDLIVKLIKEGGSYNAVAIRLNECGLKTQSKKLWNRQQIKNVMIRYKSANST